MKYYLGIDIGSSATKGVIINEQADIVAQAIQPSGLDFKNAAIHLTNHLINLANIDAAQITASCATGYGRKQASTTISKTEIACHSQAAFHYYNQAATLIDIGGQDAKVIQIANDGKVLNFRMNRSCAAGTGSFLEELSRRANIALENLPSLAENSTQELHLNSYCTVFAASELISLAQQGTPLADLAMAAYRSVVDRVRELMPLSGKLLFSGGVVAYHQIIAKMLTNNSEPDILPDSQLAGAFGAALFCLN